MSELEPKYGLLQTPKYEQGSPESMAEMFQAAKEAGRKAARLRNAQLVSVILKGFLCPNCAVPMGVHKTTRRASGVVVRRRECGTCGHRTTTEERPKKGH